MGILSNIFKKEQSVQPVKEVTPLFYNKLWLNRLTDKTGYIVTQDEKKISDTLDYLNRNNGMCPCVGVGEDALCPCSTMRNKGVCACGLFENIRSFDIKGKSDAVIRRN